MENENNDNIKIEDAIKSKKHKNYIFVVLIGIALIIFLLLLKMVAAYQYNCTYVDNTTMMCDFNENITKSVYTNNITFVDNSTCSLQNISLEMNRTNAELELRKITSNEFEKVATDYASSIETEKSCRSALTSASDDANKYDSLYSNCSTALSDTLSAKESCNVDRTSISTSLELAKIDLKNWQMYVWVGAGVGLLAGWFIWKYSKEKSMFAERPQGSNLARGFNHQRNIDRPNETINNSRYGPRENDRAYSAPPEYNEPENPDGYLESDYRREHRDMSNYKR